MEFFLGFLLKKPDLGSPDSNLSKFKAHPNARSYADTSEKLG